jgi:AcrR family transcriptional regulator
MSTRASTVEDGEVDQTRPIPHRMGREMSVKPATKHELKTRETREALMQAAETIFARDGYQGADLGEIAALAGRTKGAIYAQFASKEKVFLALVEELRKRRRAEVQALFTESSSTEGNVEALRTFYQRVAQDRTWPLLMLEFKLFAIRHPAAKAKLEALMVESLSPREEVGLAKTLGAAREGAIGRVIAIQAMQPVISALALEAEFDGAFGREALKKVVDEVFDALFGV